MAVRKLQCNISIVKWFVLNILETLLHCLLLKCWQVLNFRAASEANRDLRDFKVTSSVDSHSCCCCCLEGHVRDSGDLWGEFSRQAILTVSERKQDKYGFKLKNLNFSLKACLSLSLFAAKYQR